MPRIYFCKSFKFLSNNLNPWRLNCQAIAAQPCFQYKASIGVKAMQPEQQRILGYFVEEAKANLDIIEQHLLHSQGQIDPHSIFSELLCACHSLTGGAAMLGFDGISRMGGCLKSCFQVLQLEGSVKIDQTLKDLLMRVFYALKQSVEHLSQSSALINVTVERIVSEIEPTLEEVQVYLDLLIKRSHDDSLALDEEMLSLFEDFLINT
jgi:chemotaxis protein histidine kinase CheA